MKINTVNATFQPTKIGTANGLQITYLKDNSTRNIFVYHEDGKVRCGASLGWFNAGCVYVFVCPSGGNGLSFPFSDASSQKNKKDNYIHLPWVYSFSNLISI